MIDFIVLFVQYTELLQCGHCGGRIIDANAYLIEFAVNTYPTAYVRCEACFNKGIADESH